MFICLLGYVPYCIAFSMSYYIYVSAVPVWRINFIKTTLTTVVELWLETQALLSCNKAALRFISRQHVDINASRS